MASAIYLLCALTSVACAVLLARSWLRSREQLLVWSAICFAGLAVNNCLLFFDLVVYPHGDLTVVRNTFGLIGISSLLAGLIWETT